MQNYVAVNQPVKTPQMLFGYDNINDFGNRVQSCRMEGYSMQPTIEPCEVVAFVDCGERALTSGIYVYTMDAFGRPYYETFTLNTNEQKEIKIHGRVVASLAVMRFV